MSSEPTESDPSPPRSDEDYLTRASLFGRLNSDQARHREQAWDDFRVRYTPMIAGFARRCGAGRQDIDDIVQDVMTGFVGQAKSFVYDPAKGRFRGWLKTCTVRAAIRRAGKNLRFRGVPLDAVPEPEIATEQMWNDVWENELMAQALAAVRQQRGDDTQFRAFEQYVLCDRAAAAVATELAVSVEMVYQAKTRITQQLREAVGRLTDLTG